MSSGLVRCAFHSVLEEGDLQVDSPRIDHAKKVGRDILERVTAGEGEMTAFDEFALNT